MSIKTAIMDLRVVRRIAQLKTEAEQGGSESKSPASRGMFVIPFALAFVFALTALVGPASAAIDFSNISALLQAVVGLIPSFMDLVIGMAPLIVTIAIISFIIAFLDKILAMLKL